MSIDQPVKQYIINQKLIAANHIKDEAFTVSATKMIIYLLFFLSYGKETSMNHSIKLDQYHQKMIPTRTAEHAKVIDGIRGKFSGSLEFYS